MNILNYMVKYFLFFISLGFVLSSYAQPSAEQQIGNLKNVIPPSPNASSLAKYGSLPVNQYTGLPNISIPIYELKGRNISLPISISYHASGNKVGDVASWVGLGWSLQAGGVITRSVKGLPDENNYFPIASAFSNPNDLSSYVAQNTLSLDIVGSAKNNLDTQEDMYSFSAMGRSFKFLIKADGSVLPMPFSNVKVISNPIVGFPTAMANNSWTVVLEDGTRLLFGGGTNFTEKTDNARFKASDGSGGMVFTSSWYLNTITSPAGEVMKFTYAVSSTNIEQDAYFSQSDNIEVRTTTAVPPGTCPLITDGLISSTTELQLVTALNLASIESDLGRVDFLLDPTARLDLKGGLRLSEVKIYSKTKNQYIDDYIFKSSYANAVSGNALLNGSLNPSYFGYRLHLDSLVRKSISTSPTTLQKWTFDYNPQNLPSRRSYAQDHWGYFNGATNNTTLLPSVYYPIDNTYSPAQPNTKGFMPSLHEIGANKSVNPAFLQAEMLTAIHYPTGGISRFVYEPNSYPTSEEQFIKTNSSITLDLTSSSHSSSSQSTTFSITKPQYVSLNVSSTISAALLVDANLKVTVSILYQNGNTVASKSYVNSTDLQWYDLKSAGTYTIVVSTNADLTSIVSSSTYINATATLSYQQSIGIQNITKYIGGLRIKNISDDDGSGNAGLNARYFQYDSLLIINPLDTVNDYLTSIDRSTNTNNENCSFTKIIRNTSTKFSLGSVEGGTVGYGKVTTLYGASGSNGSTVSIFNSEPDAMLDQSTSFPYPSSDSRDWRRGLLLEQRDYDANNSLLRKTSNTYSFTNVGSVVGFKAGYSKYFANGQCIDPYENCGITRMYCFTTAEQVKQLSSKVVTYNNANADSLVTINLNYYENPLNTQPTRTVGVNSKGDSVITYSRTALDKAAINSSIVLTPGASTAIDTMVARNMVGPAIEVEKYNKGTLSNKIVTNYILQSGNLVTPDNVMIQNTFNTIETRVLFTKFDTYGNLLEQQKSADVKHSYIYDYISNYPVAEITNSPFDQTAYSSFEADGTGSWAFNGAKIVDGSAPTGVKVYNLATGNLTKSGLNSGSIYKVSYWTKNASAFTIAGTVAGYPIQGRSVNGWTYFEHKITAQTDITLSGTGLIDEVRLYPEKALMTSMTYSPLVGITSQCDVNSKISYYEYDDLNRLILIRDQDQNILKKICYNYSGQTENCNIYYNTSQSSTFTRNNCQTGYSGSSVTYTVPANIYSSTLSVADANTKALNDVQANGQAYANATGTCIAPPITIRGSNSKTSSYRVTFTNNETNASYPFSLNPNTYSLYTLGTIPAGTYKVQFSPMGSPLYATYNINGYTQYGQYGATFYNISITATSNATMY